MKRLLGLTILTSAALSASAVAAPEHERIRGTVSAISADSLSVRTADGADQAVTLTGTTKYLGVAKSSLGNIEKGSYIGTATKTVGSTLVALEVVIFPPAMKGTGDGHYAWDTLPDTTLSNGASTASTMTNGSVASVKTSANPPSVNTTMTNGSVAKTASTNGTEQLTVTYNGGQQTIVVPPTAPIVTFRPSSMSEVKKGATVFVNATKDGGTVTANAVAVGIDGVKPPM